MWWKNNLVKHENVSKHENDCEQNFLLFFMFLLMTKFVKKSHILGRIYFLFLKNVLKQSWDTLNIKFGSQWKNQKSSYQVRQILAIFSNLIALILDQYSVKGLSYQNCQINYVWRSLGQVKIKNSFPEKISYKIFETNSSFHLK